MLQKYNNKDEFSVCCKKIIDDEFDDIDFQIPYDFESHP